MNFKGHYSKIPGGDLMADKRIKCKVEECVYNTNGLCQADSIEVMSSGESMKVGTTDGTRCSTFRYQNLT